MNFFSNSCKKAVDFLKYHQLMSEIHCLKALKRWPQTLQGSKGGETTPVSYLAVDRNCICDWL